MSSPEQIRLLPHDWVPNSPRSPVVVHRAVFDAAQADLATRFELLFARNGWPPGWRDGIFDYHHYHSTAHEALGIAAGSARVLLGGPGGVEVEVCKGDAVILPAGTRHKCLQASADFLVVGAYPVGQRWDICRQAPDAQTLERIAELPAPHFDPVTGGSGWS